VGIPAFEGWGLSEGGSVQTLNLPGADRMGSVGRALPHARVWAAADGELWISGALFLGYLGGPAVREEGWPTGDLGHIDAEGHVHIAGRKRDVLITAWGRNVSPEWVETALRARESVAQAVVLCDGEAALSAVLWPTRTEAGDADLQSAVDAANEGLPDYARVAHWVRAQAPFDHASGMATPNGRPRRETVHRAHAAALGLRASPTHSSHHTEAGVPA
jgi:long-subunit acyl-CoA synthetase (AMP-forming)